MTAREVIKAIMDSKGIQIGVLGKRIGITPQAAWNRLNNKTAKDLTVESLKAMANAMDYKVVVVPADSRIREGYEI